MAAGDAGRPRRRRARPRGRLRVGLDVGGTKVLGVLLDGRRRPRHRAAADPARDRRRRRHGADAVARAVRGGRASPSTIAAVGMGVPGRRRPADGDRVVRGEPGHRPARSVPLGPLLRRAARRPGRPWRTTSTAPRSAPRTPSGLPRPGLPRPRHGRRRRPRARRAAAPWAPGRGRRGRSPALPAPTAPLCACGQRGCLELYASGLGARRRVAGSCGRPAPARSSRPRPPVTRAAARACWRRFADAVATAVRVLVLTCDVADVVLGGGVAQLGRPLLDAVARRRRRQTAGSRVPAQPADRRPAPARRRRASRSAPIGAALAVRGRRRRAPPTDGGGALMEVVIDTPADVLADLAADAVERLLRRPAGRRARAGDRVEPAGGVRRARAAARGEGLSFARGARLPARRVRRAARRPPRAATAR